eukprot:scaffold11393_cov30-Tisochrysis_lutea.AAC.5
MVNRPVGHSVPRQQKLAGVENRSSVFILYSSGVVSCTCTWRRRKPDTRDPARVSCHTSLFSSSRPVP